MALYLELIHTVSKTVVELWGIFRTIAYGKFSSLAWFSIILCNSKFVVCAALEAGDRLGTTRFGDSLLYSFFYCSIRTTQLSRMKARLRLRRRNRIRSR